MAEFLLELRSEDIPARMQVQAAKELHDRVIAKLDKAGLTFSSAVCQSTPRRLTLCVAGLARAQQSRTEERRGPRDGAPDKAIEGFLRGNGLDSLDQCELRETPKGKFWFALLHREGRATVGILSEIITDIIAELPWPKSMRWGACRQRWVRPLQGVLALFDGNKIDGEIDLGGDMKLDFTDSTTGHRFLAPEPFQVKDYADYRSQLRKAKVILDRAERKEIIRAGVRNLARGEDLIPAPTESLLEEVCGLVEWPTPLMGSIDQAFMDVPAEVLITSMRIHQKYFPLLKKDGSLAPRFVVISNMQTRDGGTTIASGNERVLKARLADAKFFWDQDRKTRLEVRVERLESIIFHAKLGTVRDRVNRLEALGQIICPYIKGAEPLNVARAARLCKSDLVTDMVFEFTELQGVMGMHYARADGENDQVAQAIADHYKPQGPSDDCPGQPVSVVLALAEKIDSLVGFFAINQKPTGSKDPYALRRAALGLIRLTIEHGLRLSLARILGQAWQLFDNQGVIDMQPNQQVQDDLMAFIADRLKVVLREKGVRHDLVDAIFALGDEDDLVRLLARVEALKGFLASEDGANLLIAFRRAANILRIEEKKDEKSYDGDVDSAMLCADEERTLWTALEAARESAKPLIESEDFVNAMAALAALRQPVDAFFDQVTVNADESGLRANRLHLLSRIRRTLSSVAAFDRIEG